VNYRHAFHAGNFADCMKHALLVWLLRAMARKPAGFFVLDTHAGRGRYDLEVGPAALTGEWRRGIGRLLEDPPAELADYVALARQCGLYPGSPVLIRALLRPQDRLACCELQPDEYAALKRLFRGDDRVAVHHRDAWEALGALLPPRQRRALVLVDPPYEPLDDFSRLAERLGAAHGRFPGGVFAAWYPIKHRARVRAFHNGLRETGVRDIVAAELWLREPLDAARLNGCGLAVINPPFRFELEAPQILRALLGRLGDGEAGAAVVLERLADE
jgi:23S rRNA (adenine2030-N6)-methyltransferase